MLIVFQKFISKQCSELKYSTYRFTSEILAKEITKEIAIPTIGIGASRYCDGQVLVIDDMIGLSNFYPKFVKQYSKVRKIVDKSIREYCKDVKTGRFPFKKNIYRS